jgi:hypothetical protein
MMPGKKENYRSKYRDMEEWFIAPQILFAGRRQYPPVHFWSYRRFDGSPKPSLALVVGTVPC